MEQRNGFDPFQVISDVEFLVWRMQVVAIEAKAHQHGFNTELSLEKSYNRNASAAACWNRRFPERLLNRLRCCLVGGAIGRCHHRLTTVVRVNRHLHVSRRNRLEMSFKQLSNLL